MLSVKAACNRARTQIGTQYELIAVHNKYEGLERHIGITWEQYLIKQHLPAVKMLKENKRNSIQRNRVRSKKVFNLDANHLTNYEFTKTAHVNSTWSVEMYQFNIVQCPEELISNKHILRAYNCIYRTKNPPNFSENEPTLLVS